MQDDERRKLERLLSGDPGPSGPERSDLEARLLGPAAPRTRLWLWAPLAGVATAAAALALLMIFLGPPGEEAADRIPEFTARGDGQTPPALRVTCLRAGGPGPLPQADGTCRLGDLLSIKVEARPGERFLSAAALGPDGVLRWYFPAQGVGSLLLGASGLATRGAVLGPDHAAGRHRLFVVLSGEPLDLDRVRAIVEAHRQGRTVELRVVETEFELQR